MDTDRELSGEPLQKKTGCVQSCVIPFLRTVFNDKILVLDLGTTIVCNFVMVFVLLTIGVVLLSVEGVNFHYEIKYTDSCDNANTPVCSPFYINVDRDYTGPFYIYLEFENFYVNHRAIQKSLDAKQLAGVSRTASEVAKNCAGMYLNTHQTNTYANTSVASTTKIAYDRLTNLVLDTKIDPADATKQVNMDSAVGVLNPCGLYANLFPNDSFVLKYKGGATIPILDTKLAFDSLKGTKFITESAQKTVQWMDPTNERFMNWMMVPLSPKKFSILWGRIEGPITKGHLELDITPDLTQSSQGVSKSFKMLMLDSVLGGFSKWLAYAYIVQGISLLFMGFILILTKRNQECGLKTKKFDL